VFETILYQQAALQLSHDYLNHTVAPALLFAGPAHSAKGTTALELARVLCCETGGDKPCGCRSCTQYESLVHPDLLLCGPRNFSAEIAASAAASPLFIRALRKLLSRFSSTLLEDDPKAGKIKPLLVSIEEELGELSTFERAEKPEKIQKCIESLKKHAFKLESEGLTNTIPIAHVRNASYWAHHTAAGRAKILIIENADCMQTGAANALLKLLEEPPQYLTIILTTAREKAILATILSRLRPYHFNQRTSTQEAAVIEHVFHEKTTRSLHAYLDSFLPIQEASLLNPLAALFAASIAREGMQLCRARRRRTPDSLIKLEQYTLSLTSDTGLPVEDRLFKVINKIIKETDSFAIRGSFSRFLATLLTIVSKSGCSSYDPWRIAVTKTAQAVDVYNQSPVQALEHLGWTLKQTLLI
jgi:DNA polymerase-3 subunit gamma/tau